MFYLFHRIKVSCCYSVSCWCNLQIFQYSLGICKVQFSQENHVQCCVIWDKLTSSTFGNFKISIASHGAFQKTNSTNLSEISLANIRFQYYSVRSISGNLDEWNFHKMEPIFPVPWIWFIRFFFFQSDNWNPRLLELSISGTIFLV